MLHKSHALFGLVLAVLGLTLAMPVRPCLGQANTATMSGTVTDKSGASIPSALIAVRNQQTNLTRSANTDPTGAYVIPLLPVGFYEITVSASGFATLKQTDNKLDVG